MGPFGATEFDLANFLDFFLFGSFWTKNYVFLTRLKITWEHILNSI